MAYQIGDFDRNLKIGVLGGIGPEASAEFYLRLVKGLQNSGMIRNNTDYPQILINNIPAPELIGETISEEQLSPYKTGLRQLDSFGVNVIVIVCNTIHLYLQQLQEGIRAPIMDIRQKVKERMLSDRVEKVAVIGTPNTIRQGLYRFDGIDYVDLSDEEISQLSAAIFSYNRGENKDVQQQIVEGIVRRCLDGGAETILLACTESAVMIKDVEIPKIDTLDVLMEGTIEFYRRMEAHRFIDLEKKGDEK